MSKKSYETGVVIIQCDGCKSRHLIADHLGWFEGGKKAGTLEDILREKGSGEQVVRLHMRDVLQSHQEVQKQKQQQEQEQGVHKERSDGLHEGDGSSDTSRGNNAHLNDGILEDDGGLMEWLPKASDHAMQNAKE